MTNCSRADAAGPTPDRRRRRVARGRLRWLHRLCGLLVPMAERDHNVPNRQAQIALVPVPSQRNRHHAFLAASGVERPLVVRGVLLLRLELFVHGHDLIHQVGQVHARLEEEEFLPLLHVRQVAEHGTEAIHSVGAAMGGGATELPRHIGRHGSFRHVMHPRNRLGHHTRHTPARVDAGQQSLRATLRQRPATEHQPDRSGTCARHHREGRGMVGPRGQARPAKITRARGLFRHSGAFTDFMRHPSGDPLGWPGKARTLRSPSIAPPGSMAIALRSGSLGLFPLWTRDKRQTIPSHLVGLHSPRLSPTTPRAC